MQASVVLLDDAPINDIISLFSHHKLLIDDEITALSLAPSDHLKKVFVSRKFQHSDLTEWSTVCTILQDSQQLKNTGDQCIKGMLHGQCCYCVFCVYFALCANKCI